MNGEESRQSTRWLMPVVVFFVVAVMQLWLVGAAGSDVPFHDQWDVEGRGTYPALRDGTASWGDVFRRHNEHRIVWTQLLNRGLFSINGQWDPLVQMSAGALLHATAACLLAAMLARGRGRSAGWILGFAVVLFSVPIAGWHNALWGFQTQVYFAVVFALLAFELLAPGSTWNRMAGGFFAAGAAMLAMGPGLLVPLALGGGVVLSVLAGNARRREILTVLALTGVACWLYRNEPSHADLRAGSVKVFLSAFGRMLAWPHTAQPWAALILNIPVAVVLFRQLSQRQQAAEGETGILMLAGWGLLVAAGAAWSRGGGAEFAVGVPSRYTDFMVLMPLANIWCAIGLVQNARSQTRGLAAAWIGFLLVGLVGLSAEVLRGVILPRMRDRDAPVRLMQEFQRTGNPGVFAGQPRLLVPHPNLESVRAVVDDPRMQGALPPSMQPAEPMGPLSRAVRRGLGR